MRHADKMRGGVEPEPGKDEMRVGAYKSATAPAETYVPAAPQV